MSDNGKYLFSIVMLGVGGYIAYKYFYKPKPAATTKPCVITLRNTYTPIDKSEFKCAKEYCTQHCCIICTTMGTTWIPPNHLPIIPDTLELECKQVVSETGKYVIAKYCPPSR